MAWRCCFWWTIIFDGYGKSCSRYFEQICNSRRSNHRSGFINAKYGKSQKIRNHNLLSKYLFIIVIITISVQTWLHVGTGLKRRPRLDRFITIYEATVGRVSRRYEKTFFAYEMRPKDASFSYFGSASVTSGSFHRSPKTVYFQYS